MSLLSVSLLVQGLLLPGPKLSSWPKCPDTTVISLHVRVPVLSTQMVVTLPMTSQDRSTLTSMLSLNMCVLVNARAAATARDSPSGTAITTSVIASMKTLRNASPISRGVADDDGLEISIKNLMKRPAKYSSPTTEPSMSMDLAK